jgi:type I restriction enzyme R subunit
MGLLSRQVEDILYLLKKKGNAAAHDNVGLLADVILLLQSAFHLGKWLVRTYGVGAAVVPVEFMLPTQRDTQQELTQLAAEKDTLQQRVTELQATLAARPHFT